MIAKGRPPGLDTIRFISTGVSWYGIDEDTEAECQVVKCPGCGQKWTAEYPNAGGALQKYRDHTCITPEFPRELGRPPRERSKSKLIQELADHFDWTEGEEYVDYDGSLAIRTPGLEAILFQLKWHDRFTEVADVGGGPD